MKDSKTESEQKLVDYACEKVLAEFYKTNQYYYFDANAKNDLKNIYVVLLNELKSKTENSDTISTNHYHRLKEWLIKTNAFALKMYNSANPEAEKVPCFEYTPDLQIEILKINIPDLMQPVLDIGCGKDGNMVCFLRQNGIEAYGIDVCNFENPDLSNSDWLEFNYGVEKWGTVISNLGFSNHFHHHHLREDGKFEEYAIKYMEILNSLKTGGSFHYAPDLDFIEIYLDRSIYKLSKHSFSKYNFKSSTVTKMM